MRALKSVEEAAVLLAISPWTVRGYVCEQQFAQLGKDALHQFVAFRLHVAKRGRDEDADDPLLRRRNRCHGAEHGFTSGKGNPSR